MHTQKANVNQTKSSSLALQVTNDLTVQVFPNDDYEFLMSTKEVARGYGTSTYAIQQSFHRNPHELINGKHYFTALTFCQGSKDLKPIDFKLPPNAILWTKRGIVRLGFFIKSERAKLFRDWAEELIIKIDEQKDLFGQSVQSKTLPEPKKRNHNRLTAERLLDIMADVVKIEDEYLRLKITKKLGL